MVGCLAIAGVAVGGCAQGGDGTPGGWDAGGGFDGGRDAGLRDAGPRDAGSLPDVGADTGTESGCSGDLGCPPGGHCEDGVCVPDRPAGESCTADGDCVDGLFCVSNVCCTTACEEGGGCGVPDCTGGSCTYVPSCAGTTASCGCTTCADCSLEDGWYDVGPIYACCEGGQRCSSCQDQEYRAHTCDGTSCVAAVTSTRTNTSGCLTCDDSNACTQDTCSAGMCSSADRCAGTATSCGCSSCTNCSALPHVASASCNSGACAIGACSAGWTQCDTSTANGCERGLDTCASGCCSSSSLGSAAGDTNTWRQVATVSNTGERCYTFRFTEPSTACRDVAGQFVLRVPSGVDYDLYVTGNFDGCQHHDGTQWVNGCSGIRGTGLVDQVWFWLGDDCSGGDDDITARAEIRFHSGSTCESWTLEVNAH